MKKQVGFLMTCLLVFGVWMFGETFVAQAADNYELQSPKVLATYGDIEIKGESSYSFVLPCDRILVYEMIVTNQSSGYKYVRFDPESDVSGPSSVTSHLASDTEHPQPKWMELQPGESNTIQIAIDVLDASGFQNVKNASLSQNIKFTIKDVDENGLEASDENAEIHTFTLKSTVTTYSKKRSKRDPNVRQKSVDI